jgi:predicted NodU family carbamoyl transferase
MAMLLDMKPYSEGKIMGMSAYGHHNLGYVEEEELISPADKALRLQNKTFDNTCDLIEHAITYSDCKNIVLSGGYALNCVNNYRLVKKYLDINFYFEPMSTDAGVSYGAVKHFWHEIKSDTTIRKLENIYLGDK